MLRDNSIENADGARYLRLYGDEGIFIRLLITEDGESVDVQEETEYTESVEYLKDKMTTRMIRNIRPVPKIRTNGQRIKTE